MIAIDTSVVVASTVEPDLWNAVARANVGRASHVPTIALAEAWSTFTRSQRIDPGTARAILMDLCRRVEVFAPTVEDTLTTLEQGPAFNLHGNIHDAIIVQACQAKGLALMTLDRGQAQLAAGRIEVINLLAA